MAAVKAAHEIAHCQSGSRKARAFLQMPEEYTGPTEAVRTFGERGLGEVGTGAKLDREGAE